MTGFCVEPRPRALVAYYGYGDVDGDWYTKPSPHYRRTQPLQSQEEVLAALSWEVVTVPKNLAQAKARQRYYHHLRQNGLWTREVTGFDPVTERSKLDSYCPVRNVTPSYPPTLLLHGTEDSDVPCEQSAAMARELARHQVPRELITVPGAEHGLAGGDRQVADRAHARALEFVKSRCGVQE